MDAFFVALISFVSMFLFFHFERINSWYLKFVFPIYFLYLGAVEAETIIQALLFGASAVFAFLAFTHFDEQPNNSNQFNETPQEFLKNNEEDNDFGEENTEPEESSETEAPVEE